MSEDSCAFACSKQKGTKNPDSSPASNICERNYRDCAAKIRRIVEPTKQFLEEVFSTQTDGLGRIIVLDVFGKVCYLALKVIKWLFKAVSTKQHVYMVSAH